MTTQAQSSPALSSPAFSSTVQLDELIAKARGFVQNAKRIVVLSGAGISTDSGIPDFRGPQGVWTKDPEAEKLSTISHYVSEPEVRKRNWKRYTEGNIWTQKEPNEGHQAIVELERQCKLHCLITQNIDGLHEEAGTSPELLVEIHGTVKRVRCLNCQDENPMEYALERVRSGEDDPACEKCGGILKSATISFGQSLVPRDLMRAEAAAQTCDLLLAVGTSLSVYPVADCVPIARHAGANVVIVNNEPTPMDHLAAVVINENTTKVLPQLVA